MKNKNKPSKLLKNRSYSIKIFDVVKNLDMECNNDIWDFNNNKWHYRYGSR